MNLNQTTTIPSGKDIKRKWFVLDASGQTLGRLASHAASVLAGKTNPLYTPYIDMGDHVIVINAEKIEVTGMKAGQKLYRRYTGFPGGLREEEFSKLLARRPEKILEEAIKGMLPKSKLGRQMATKLKVYKGADHPHHAQHAHRHGDAPLRYADGTAPEAGAPPEAVGLRIRLLALARSQQLTRHKISWASGPGTKRIQHGRFDSVLRHRTSQERNRPRLPAPRLRQVHRQWQAV